MVDALGVAVSTAAPVRLRRFRRPWKIVVVAILLAGALVGSFFLGQSTESPTRDALATADKPIIVTAPAEMRAVDAGAAFAGVVNDGQTQPVTVVSSAVLSIVTRQGLHPGDPVTGGTLLGVVSGQPYFALPAPLPLYRDLAAGDKGDDVSALQTSLAATGAKVRVTGTVDSATTSAVRQMFKAQGIPLADGPIPFRQFVAIGSGTVVGAAAVGTTVDEETPLLSVKLSPNFVSFRADSIDAGTFAVGDPMTVQAGGQAYPVQIQAIGEFSEGTDGEIPGRQVNLVSADEQFLQLKVGTSVTIVDAVAAEEALAVPLVAVRQDNSGTYVERKTASEGKTKYERVPVTVLRNGGGWAALEEGGLAVGDEVSVS